MDNKSENVSISFSCSEEDVFYLYRDICMTDCMADHYSALMWSLSSYVDKNRESFDFWLLSHPRYFQHFSND